MEKARSAGAITSLDLALPDPESPAGRADWRAILSAALPHTDLFVPSLEELLFMLQRDRFAELTASHRSVVDGFDPHDLRGLARSCIAMGAEIVVLKCGHVGAYMLTSDRLHRVSGLLGEPASWRAIEMFEPTCRVEHIVSTAGSGDSSIAGFLAALLRGENPRRCMEALTVIGAQNLSALDAVSGVDSWEQTVSQLESCPEKNPLPPRLASLGG
jgi:sugar/nucleoside kinase (ribokinase family)